MRGVLLDTTVLIDVGRRFAPTVAWVERQRRSRCRCVEHPRFHPLLPIVDHHAV